MNKRTTLFKWMITVMMACFCGAMAFSRADAQKTVILLDQAHGQHFSFDRQGALDLSQLKKEIEKVGGITKIGRSSFTSEGLKGVSAIIISGAFKPLSPKEVDVLSEFVKRGGRLFIALHIGAPLYGILDRLGISVSNGIIRERENVIGSNGLDFMVVDLGPWPIFKDLGHFNVYGCWALRPTRSSFKSVARTSRQAWVDLNRNRILDRRDAIGRFSIAVHGIYGAGEVVVFGDDAIFQNTFLKGQNLELARRISKWLVGAQRQRQNLDGFI